MGFDNTITVVGNVTRDPELRFAQSGTAIASFGVAWNRRRQDQEDEVSFFDVTCFRQLAENVAESIHKGARVVIYGTLQQRSWQTDSGDRRSKVEILADDVAPSLRWATAAITRNERPGGGDHRGGHRTEGGSRGSDRSRPGGHEALESRQSGGTQPTGGAGPSVDEEPF
ncbi:MAG: single-stranded DNA-binding protein [Acidimicrobiaceae bacterium]|nr:single-stranded DNA-binding protein [Acidimicrobiaceae bacterium]MYE75134.1 single-stranded DNA-binding protein [Acidimicrobiaceae bacterium]MYH42827.1 single-stranded DNA-binding protein [Acidimicrobiaceae bacterium]MYJ42155.1 single-stranded DNA-binding protein [Acidimicrobiaceae bacterium]MYK74958.1 single-stranded DNA-binding protein [Acidimicrobiaceae bacterium]